MNGRMIQSPYFDETSIPHRRRRGSFCCAVAVGSGLKLHPRNRPAVFPLWCLARQEKSHGMITFESVFKKTIEILQQTHTSDSVWGAVP